MRFAAILLATVAAIAPLQAQEWSNEVARILAEDGMSLEFFGPTTSGERERFAGANVEVPGHIRLDGWFVGPSRIALGQFTRTDDDLSMPTLSIPLRRTEIAFHDGRIEGLKLSTGGVLGQDFDRLTFSPVAMSKEDGVFVSIEQLTIEPDEAGCFEIVVNGLALSAKKTIPAIAGAGKDFYKGDARIGFGCDADSWTMTSIDLEAEGFGTMEWRGEVGIPAQAILDLVVERRTAMNQLFLSNANVMEIMMADAMVYLDVADLVSTPGFTFSFSDDGILAALRQAVDGASWLGMRDVAMDKIVSAFPSDLQESVGNALSDLLSGSSRLEVSLVAPDASMRDLALGEIPAASWSITTSP